MISTTSLILAGAVFFLPMFLKLFGYGWKAADYDHGAFIAPISALIIFSKRKLLVADTAFKTRPLVYFILSVLVYLYAAGNDFLFLQVLGFIGIVASVFFLRYTPDTVKVVSFALAYLLF